MLDVPGQQCSHVGERSAAHSLQDLTSGAQEMFVPQQSLHVSLETDLPQGLLDASFDEQVIPTCDSQYMQGWCECRPGADGPVALGLDSLMGTRALGRMRRGTTCCGHVC